MQPISKWMTAGAVGFVAAAGLLSLPANATVYPPSTAATTTTSTSTTVLVAPITAAAATTTVLAAATGGTVGTATTVAAAAGAETEVASGTLPITGSDPSTTVYVAVGLVVAGGSAVALTRRRKRPAPAI